jgi:hypothetical protein
MLKDRITELKAIWDQARADIALGGQRRLGSLDDTLGECVPVLRVHRCKPRR